jgi:hypothetical protein
VFCVDADGGALCEARKSLSPLLPRGVKFIHTDFLTWAEQTSAVFDCIVMNPPFAGGKAHWRLANVPVSSDKSRFMPTEIAFLSRAIELLREGGRLLAIVPCSVIMSESAQWLRDSLGASGAIRFVHELPPRSFPHVESRMYLFVFDKGRKQRKIILYNHDLTTPERLDLYLTSKSRVERLDFGYHQARSKLARLRDHDTYGWRDLGELAVVLRGDIASPQGPRCAVHTVDYDNGFWRRSDRHSVSAARNREHTIRRGDILVKRVARDCCRTFGISCGLQGMPCSDCVLIVRPITPSISMRLLFALRALFELRWSSPLIERGTGASYISQASLLKMSVPIDLCQCCRASFTSFVLAQKRECSEASRRIIRQVARHIDRYS